MKRKKKKMHIAQRTCVNISERKSGTERTKKCKKLELVVFSPPGDTTGTVVHRLEFRRYTDFARATITDNPGYLCLGPSMRSVTDKTHPFFLQTDTWHDQIVILYYEIHSFRIIVADFAERISFAECDIKITRLNATYDRLELSYLVS